MTDQSWKSKDLLGCFCAQNGVMPVKRGEHIVIILPFGDGQITLETIEGGAKHSPAQPWPQEIQDMLQRLQDVLVRFRRVMDNEQSADGLSPDPQ